MNDFHQQFAQVQHLRMIESCEDIPTLRDMAKTMYLAWYQMRAVHSKKIAAELLAPITSDSAELALRLFPEACTEDESNS